MSTYAEPIYGRTVPPAQPVPMLAEVAADEQAARADLSSRSPAGYSTYPISALHERITSMHSANDQAKRLVADTNARLETIHSRLDIGDEQRRQITRQLIGEAEAKVQELVTIATANRNVIGPLAEMTAYPTVARTSTVADAKSDLRLSLDGVPARDVDGAALSLLAQLHGQGDAVAMDLLIGPWGRSYLYSRLGDDAAAGRAHTALRVAALPLLESRKDIDGERRRAVRVLQGIVNVSKAHDAANYQVHSSLDALRARFQ